MSYFAKFVYTLAGTLPAIIGIIIQTRGFKTVAEVFTANDLTNFWSYVVVVLAVAAFIFFIHFIAMKDYEDREVYPMWSASTFSSAYGIILSAVGAS